MTNKEKKERIQKEDGKAFETFNIERDVTYLNQKYTLPKQTANVMTGNGLLKVFELNPSEGGPSFIGRWDGGSRDPGKTERYDLDIDIYRVSRQETRRFKKGERGYSGHHTTKVESDRGHKYQVSLCTPDEKIFEGTVCFNLHRRIGVSDQISVRDRATAVVTRGRSPRPAAPLVDNFYYQTLRAGLFQLSSCFYASPKNLVPMKFAGGFGGGMIMPGTEDGEIPIRLARLGHDFGQPR